MYDISMAIGDRMPVYKNRQHLKPKLEAISTHQQDGVQESRLQLTAHTGTHLDAPRHMLDNGETSDSLLEGDQFYRARVIDLQHQTGDRITADELNEADINRGQFVLLKTRNSLQGFLKENPEDFVFLEESAAELLVDRGAAGTGIDSIGIERSQPGHPTHKHLLKNGVMILEGLRLNAVPSGSYILSLCPLKIPGTDGLPARALLYKPEELLQKINKLIP